MPHSQLNESLPELLARKRLGGVFFHYTRPENLPSILAEGIKKDADSSVYMTMLNWEHFLELEPEKHLSRVTVRIPADFSYISLSDGSTIISKHDIPASFIIGAEINARFSVKGLNQSLLNEVSQMHYLPPRPALSIIHRLIMWSELNKPLKI